jgi:hypothetical protein
MLVNPPDYRGREGSGFRKEAIDSLRPRGRALMTAMSVRTLSLNPEPCGLKRLNGMGRSPLAAISAVTSYFFGDFSFRSQPQFS